MQNYFNQLTIREQQLELGKCRLMQQSEFSDGVSCLNGEKIVIIGYALSIPDISLIIYIYIYLIIYINLIIRLVFFK